jgi:hypothetical protein
MSRFGVGGGAAFLAPPLPVLAWRPVVPVRPAALPLALLRPPAAAPRPPDWLLDLPPDLLPDLAERGLAFPLAVPPDRPPLAARPLAAPPALVPLRADPAPLADRAAPEPRPRAAPGGGVGSITSSGSSL